MRLSIFFPALFSLLFAGNASAAALSLSPSAGTFEIGSTFTVSVFLDTQGQPVNVVDVDLRFPVDRLQLVSPTTGKSMISVWTAQPTYDNKKGRVILQGGIPGGITTSSGLITTLEFRARAMGQAAVRFSDDSRVLAHDGRGTDVLYNIQNGVYNFVLPPPAGPIVASQTHPDQTAWYANPTIVLSWTNAEEVEEYSYVLSAEPIEVPDDISEGSKQSSSYKNLSSGTHYFHIKALRNGVWGGMTHFAVNVDTEPPAEFGVEIGPSKITTSKDILLRYQTTDRHSGIDRYEYAIIALAPAVEAQEQNIFIEGKSPQSVRLEHLGRYDVIVRAYDKAGNVREAVERLEITTWFGVILKNVWTWLLAGFITLVLAILAWRILHLRQGIERLREGKKFPEDVEKQLHELKEYRKRYGNRPWGGNGTLMPCLLLVLFSAAALFGAANPALAQSEALAPPFVSTVSRNISNNEIFYIGGRTDAGNVGVLIFLQNLQTGETRRFGVEADNQGRWFYRHDAFMGAGEYLLWTQAKLAEELSPPSPQIQMAVRQTALQFGASRVSLETLYMLLALFLLAVNVGLVWFITAHFRHARRGHKEWLREVHEAEQSVRRGFAVLKRDIERELEIIHKAKLSKELSAEEKRREEQLLKDLQWAEQYIGKEIWDIEETGEPH